MKILLFSIFFSIVLSFQLQSQNPVVDSLVSKIDNYNRLNHEQTGMTEAPSDQYRYFEKLSQKASTPELLSLLKHKNPVVQGYASWSLIEKKYDKLDSVFSYFGKSGLTVATQQGCLVSHESLLSEFYYRLYRQIHYKKNTSQDSLILEGHLSNLDSMVLFDRIKGKRLSPPDYYLWQIQDTSEVIPDFPVVDRYLLSNVLRNNKAHPGRYEAVRRWAIEKENEDALIPLALYQRDSDIDAFKAQGSKSFQVIPYFQAPELRAFLISHGPNDYGSDYFTALASFQDQAALDSLSAIYERLHKRNSQTLIANMANAIYKHYDAIYSDLSLQIMAEHGNIPIALAKLFIKEKPKEMAKASLKRLQESGELLLMDSDYEFSSETPMTQVLELIRTYNPESIPDICSKYIEATDFLRLEVYTDFVRRYKINSTAKVILKKLEKEDVAFDTFHLTQALLSFQDTSYHSELAALLKSSRDNWDWNNWSKSFSELFNKYNFSLN